MTTDSPKMEFPEAFERRLGMQLVEEGIEKQRAFFKEVATGLLWCAMGDVDEREAASEFVTLFGKAYLEACQLYLSNLPISAFVSSMKLPKGVAAVESDAETLVLMLFCEAVDPTGNIVDDNGRLTPGAETNLAVSTFVVHASKFTTPKPNETVEECLHRFISTEKAAFDAMNLGEGPEFVKWTLRYIYDMAITHTIEAMEPEFVLMRVDDNQARFVIHQDIPGEALYKATSIHLNLGVLFEQGVASFQKQIYRHPRYRATPPDAPKEAIVEAKNERDIATVIKSVLEEVPQAMRDEEPHSGYVLELNEILELLSLTPLENKSARWNQFIEIMNTWMPPAEILVHEWMLKAIAKLMDQPEEKVREVTQRYIDSGGGTDD